MARKGLLIFLTILGLFLVGTVVVLSSISYWLAIDQLAYVTEREVPSTAGRDNSTSSLANERIPRILHQTWKTDTLPERWQPVSQQCRDLMPDYEYILWTDAKSRDFIAEEYPWFLSTFDNYKYPIQRADAIRYFVLYHYGGVYLDLDVGCLRSLDPLLKFDVVLPRTIPVGLSNDIMFAAKRHPFMDQTIHNLIAFDYSWILNYPTVMFSTGPMFLSAQYSLYYSTHPPTLEQSGGEVRILPKSLYGKNAKEGEALHSFFEHYYGSSWHADDAGFIGFLGTWGKGLMWVGLIVMILGVGRIVWARTRMSKGQGGGRRRFGRYDLLLPRPYQDREGNSHIDLGPFTLSTNVLGQSGTTTLLTSPTTSRPPSPSEIRLPFSLDGQASASWGSTASRAFSRAGSWAASIPLIFLPTPRPADDRRTHRRSPSSRGYLFFLPAIFTPSGGSADRLSRRPSPLAPYDLGSSLEKNEANSGLETANLLPAESISRSASALSRSSSFGGSEGGSRPPPYRPEASVSERRAHTRDESNVPLVR